MKCVWCPALICKARTESKHTPAESLLIYKPPFIFTDVFADSQ